MWDQDGVYGASTGYPSVQDIVASSSAGQRRGQPAKRRLAAVRLVAHHRRLEDAQNGDHTQLIRAHTPDAQRRQPRTKAPHTWAGGSSSSMEDDFNRSMRECEDLIGRLAQFGTHSPLIESTNTFREKTQERLAQLRAKFPRPPVQEQRAPTPPPPPEIWSRPDWLAQATATTAQSPEFRQLCRELLWRVESSEQDFGGQSSFQKCATLDDAYAK